MILAVADSFGISIFFELLASHYSTGDILKGGIKSLQIGYSTYILTVILSSTPVIMMGCQLDGYQHFVHSSLSLVSVWLNLAPAV